MVSIDKKIKTNCSKKVEIINSDHSLSSLANISCTNLTFFSSLFSAEEEKENEIQQEPDNMHNQEIRIMVGSATDSLEQHRVLSEQTMYSLRQHLSFSDQEQNFLLKYSLARDGASLITLLSKARNSPRTILAIKTVEGDIFGAFTCSSWRDRGNNFYGSGESFLWRRKRNHTLDESRDDDDTCSREDNTRVSNESNFDVFSWSGANRNIQLANFQKLIVGGGEPPKEETIKTKETKQQRKKNWNFGLMLNSDLSGGSSGCCATFGSPCLSSSQSFDDDSDFFEIANVELWALTPASTIEQAEKMEDARAFIYKHNDFVEA